MNIKKYLSNFNITGGNIEIALNFTSKYINMKI